MIDFNWTLIRAKLKEAILVLPQFFKNPVQGIRQLPDWDWPTLLILQGTFAAACAMLSNVLERDPLGVITSLFISPIAAYLVVGIAAGFFYYLFLFLFQREIPYRQIYLHVVFASIPTLLVSIIAPLIPPVMLVGFTASLLLLYVGFADNFYVDRPKLRKIFTALLVGYFIFWAYMLVSITKNKESRRLKATPESLDILEKELKFDE